MFRMNTHFFSFRLFFYFTNKLRFFYVFLYLNIKLLSPPYNPLLLIWDNKKWWDAHFLFREERRGTQKTIQACIYWFILTFTVLFLIWLLMLISVRIGPVKWNVLCIACCMLLFNIHWLRIKLFKICCVLTWKCWINLAE